MHIQELVLQTRHIADQKAFYCTTLGLSLLGETTDSFTVQAGMTRLCFQATGQDVLYHIAFAIPHNIFYEAKSWIQKRINLLDRDGEDEIFFTNLNARSFYFCDPIGNILEYIGYYSLNHETKGAFEAASMLYVSEIGLPVEDVPAFTNLLQKQFTIEAYGGSISEDFAFLGDISGQLVVVKIGRPWLPTRTVLAAVAPVKLIISGQREQQIQLLPYPYIIAITPS